ncbi:hypothetical protein KUTeg_001759 [Tegillarca granosa]|uniref:Uncharacterized protein n=1 Tax=Tegillarca granosa TaxID=220873 RepID=A0ABQ9FW13_TEGGR|nr:hypothetical protein KUTeg_001759 [Tegillarca granosa]
MCSTFYNGFKTKRISFISSMLHCDVLLFCQSNEFARILSLVNLPFCCGVLHLAIEMCSFCKKSLIKLKKK